MFAKFNYRRWGVAGLALALVTAGLSVVTSIGAPAASAAGTIPPVVPRSADTVTADALPTAQINGVVWEQAMAGNTVYAGGDFTKARPAGSAAGQNEVTRNNLLAFDVRTGVLSTSFLPNLNGVVKTVAVSPDKSRLYVAGLFTTANGQPRTRIAAYSTATGQLISTFAPQPNSYVTAIAVTNTTVYAAGYFSAVNGNTRVRLAAFNASNGALLAWSPTADADINAMTLTPDQSRVIIGGKFETANGSPAYGIASLDATTGALLPFNINTIVRNAGPSASTVDLSVDGDTVYGTSFNYGGGNFEGTWAADPMTGDVRWLDDCHGDTYDTFSTGDVVYNVGHAHFCTNIGGFPDTNPRVPHAAMAFTKAVGGVVQPNNQGGAGYGDFTGQPSPSIMNWFPLLDVGTFTGQQQAAWSLTGNSDYLVAGGEFPKVNGVAQQGLVRFAVPSIAPKTSGPVVTGDQLYPTAVVIGPAVKLNWQTNWDRDDIKLTYQIIRSDRPTSAVGSVEADSLFWNRPSLSFKDSTVVPGATYTYRVRAIDPNGNFKNSGPVTVTIPTDAALSPYASSVISDGAVNYWRLGDTVNPTLADWVGSDNLTRGAGVTAAAGAFAGDSNGAATFSGDASGTASTSSAQPGPNVFTMEAWIKTTTTSGGKIVGFGSAQAPNNSNSYDRHLYMQNDGKVTFGVFTGVTNTISSTQPLNDGQWHYTVAQLSASGMKLYVDGLLVGSNGSVTNGEGFSGFWRVGGDNLGSWPSAPSSSNFAGSIDDLAIYSGVLTSTKIRDHFIAGGGTLNLPTSPTDDYGKAVYADDPSLYWRLNEASGPSVGDISTSKLSGTSTGGVTFGSPSTVNSPAGTAVTFNGTDGTIGSDQSSPSPSTYSEELWFKTTTDRGGKLIGFGGSPSGNSSNYDRHVYMLDSGQLVFGTWTGQTNLITSPSSYNDGTWHHMVATQGANGMVLYVDGSSVGTNPQTQAQPYTGYWRVGGDTSWGGSSNYFAGSIDEVAIYGVQLSAAQVAAHVSASPAAPNQQPVAAFTNSCNAGKCNFDASTSGDPDGSIATYSWNFGDNTSAGAGSTPTHEYAESGSYVVKLTVTDNRGAIASKSVTVQVAVPVNQAPTAGFTTQCAALSCSFDASGSADSDGSITKYEWNFGDGVTGGGVNASHAFTAADTYTVTLKVTDNDGAVAEKAGSVQVFSAPNQAPVAAFVASGSGLNGAFDGTSSTDDSGVTAYDWKFGDGTTGTGPTPTHAYSGSGVYTVTLTATDAAGLTSDAVKQLTIIPGATLAKDLFSRVGAAGVWASADAGGVWTLSAGATLFSTDGTAGKANLNAPGAGPTALLKSTSQANVDIVVDASIDKPATGTGAQLSVFARKVGSSDYRAKIRFTSAGKVNVIVSKVVAGTETSLREVSVAGMTYTPGEVVRLRFKVTGDGASTTLAAKAWKAGTAEPVTFGISLADTTASLQGAGSVGLQPVLYANATNAPVIMTIDNFLASAI